MTTLVDVYFKTLNFNPRIVFSKHAAERLVERKLDIEPLVIHLKDIERNFCVKIFECVIRGGIYRNSAFGMVTALSFNDVSKKIIVRTVY